MKEKDIKEFVSRTLKQMRLDAGLTQEQLAAKMGMKQPNIARVEGGELEPGIVFMSRYADACGKRLVISYD